MKRKKKELGCEAFDALVSVFTRFYCNINRFDMIIDTRIRSTRKYAKHFYSTDVSYSCTEN